MGRRTEGETGQGGKDAADELLARRRVHEEGRRTQLGAARVPLTPREGRCTQAKRLEVEGSWQNDVGGEPEESLSQSCGAEVKEEVTKQREQEVMETERMEKVQKETAQAQGFMMERRMLLCDEKFAPGQAKEKPRKKQKEGETKVSKQDVRESKGSGEAPSEASSSAPKPTPTRPLGWAPNPTPIRPSAPWRRNKTE